MKVLGLVSKAQIREVTRRAMIGRFKGRNSSAINEMDKIILYVLNDLSYAEPSLVLPLVRKHKDFGFVENEYRDLLMMLITIKAFHINISRATKNDDITRDLDSLNTLEAGFRIRLQNMNLK